MKNVCCINSFVLLGQNYRSSHPELFLYTSRSENFLKIHHETRRSGVLLYQVAVALKPTTKPATTQD